LRGFERYRLFSTGILITSVKSHVARTANVRPWILKGQPMTHIAVAIIFCSLFLPREILAQQNGSLTIFTVPDTWSKYVGPGKYCESSKLSVRIDNGDTVQWPRKQRVQVKDLALDQSHLVTARCGGKPLQAVRFRFSDFKSTNLCVSYDVYGGIYLFDYTTRGWGCKQTSPTSDPD
jgi:hypothetical protein